MYRLGHHLLSKSSRAVLFALGCAFFGPLQWFASVIMALVTLRNGPRAGAIVLLWITLPSAVTAFQGQWFFFVHKVVFGYGLTFALACILRRTRSWTKMIDAVVAFGLTSVCLMHLLLPDVSAWWIAQLQPLFDTLFSQANLAAGDPTLTALAPSPTRFAFFATGLNATVVSVLALITLGLARFWQARLFNPGGLRRELHHLRLSKLTLGVAVVVCLLASIKNSTALDCIPVVLLPFALAGISLMHFSVKKQKRAWIWLSLFYAIFFIFIPYAVVALILVTLLDSWFNFRQRGKQRGNYLTNKSS